jgi:hypothetical protein
MRAAVIFWVAMTAAQASVVSRDWADGRLTLKLDDGAAEMEWLSPVAFRFARSWTGEIPSLPKIAHDKISPELEDVGSTLTMRSRYLTVVLDREDLKLQVKSAQNTISSSTLVRSSDGVDLRLVLRDDERIFGLLGGTTGKLNVRGEKLERERGFFFTSAGYGVSVRSPSRCVFDMISGTIHASGATSIEYSFYFGPAAKEVMEQYGNIISLPEVKGDALDLLTRATLPKAATALPARVIESWEELAGLVRTLNQWSLSAVIYPALDLASFNGAPEDVKRRAEDLSSMLPILYRSSGEGGVDVATRAMWTPYLLTYLREAYDRGYPLIRPLPMEFSRDSDSDRQNDVFMLGDEVLLAPVTGAGDKRRLFLPRGTWTDLRTNAEYSGNQPVEVDAPPGRVPMLVRNGWIVPLAVKDKMELHYFPSLGGEFFLWEPDVNENSQFHASPAGDYVRVEIESQKRRTYEWVLHHMKSPNAVAEDSGAYQRAAERSSLKPGEWWHDDALNNLHIMLRSEPKTDRIVNISF